tara:strand:- start:48 stop:176 length:129 start_codon:yes stop_codon:yes gene_type:complete
MNFCFVEFTKFKLYLEKLKKYFSKLTIYKFKIICFENIEFEK